MPKYKTVTIKQESEAGDKFEQKVTFNINDSGEFYVSSPGDLSEIMYEIVKKSKTCHYRDGKYYSKTYLDLNGLVYDAVKEFLTTEKIIETVILYKFGFKGEYYIDKNSNIFPLSSIAGKERDKAEGKWEMNDRGFSSRGEVGFHLKVFAFIMNKVTFKRNQTTKVEFEEKDFGNTNLTEPDDSWGMKLNSIDGMYPDYDAIHSSNQIPYTEENAKFFYDLLMSMAKMNEKIKNFNDPKVLLERIENVTMLPLFADKKEQE